MHSIPLLASALLMVCCQGREGKPKFKADDLNSDYIKNGVIK